MKREFKLKCGTEYELPVVKMTNGITINFFDPYDINLVRKILTPIMIKISELAHDGFKTIIVPATKPIPIAWYLAQTIGLELVVIKKEMKPYFPEVISFTSKSITSDKENILFVTPEDVKKIKDKKVIFFDDVISTGATYNACKDFIMNTIGCEDFKAFFVLKEGKSVEMDEHSEYFGYIPFGEE